MENKKLQEVTLTMQEIWLHTKPKVEQSKKVYSRKDKHKGKDGKK
jgi:hypothetical protein